MRKTILALGSAAVLSLSGAGIAAAQPTDPAPGTDTAPTSPQTDAETTDAAPNGSGSAAQMLCAVLGTPADGDDEGTDTTDPSTDDATGDDTTGTDATTYQDAATDENNLEATETEQGADTGVAGAEPVEPATGDELGDALDEATGQETGEADTGTGNTGTGEDEATGAGATTATGPGTAALAGLAGPDCEVNVSELLNNLTSGDLDSASAVLSAEAPDEGTTPDATEPGATDEGTTDGATDEGTTAGAGDDQLDSEALTTEEPTTGDGTY